MTHIFSSFFFFNDTATTEIYTLSLHDALPIYSTAVGTHHAVRRIPGVHGIDEASMGCNCRGNRLQSRDRKSTRLNSSHLVISYAVFCLKKKNNDVSTPL